MKKYDHISYFGRIIERKSSPRSLLWTLSMTIIVTGLIIYLNIKAGGM